MGRRYATGGALASRETVMTGHNRSKNGVAKLAYVPAIHAFIAAME
jgi:hypothetical protein